MLILNAENPRNDPEKEGNYYYLIVILFVTHLVQFLFIRELMVLKRRGDDNKDKFVDASAPVVEDDIVKVFNYKYWWFWFISFTIEAIVLALYFTTNGDELYFIYWIPTDFIFFTCVFGYYCLEAYKYQKVKEQEEALAQDLQDRL